MTAPRIGDRDLARTVRPDSEASIVGERLGAALASPIGILLVIPGLVAAVGLFLTLLGQAALRESTTQLGRDRFAERTAAIAQSVASSLAQTDPMLDRMRELATTWTASDPSGPIAHALRGLIQGRAGIAYASVSYPDGTFQAAYLDDDGAIRFQEVRRAANDAATMSRFDFVGIDGLTLRSSAPSTYDPRARGFYRLAVDTGRRVWTKPYTFFSSRHTGVTRTEPVYEPTTHALRAVLTADFDVHGLSEAMAHPALPGARTLLYTDDGTLLAYPEGFASAVQVPITPDRPLSYRDLHDPVIDAFFARPNAHAAAGTFDAFKAEGNATLAMVIPVPGFAELGWSVAAIVPEPVFFRTRIVHERHSLIAAAIALVAALGVAVVFARHVVRVQRAATRARDIARKADERAQELGSYRLVERLGQGGMGEVWRAEHRLLVRQAAIKLIRKEVVSTTRGSPVELRERFRREAQTLATLRSRHTIEIFDYGVTEDGTFFFVMELLLGMDLDTLVARDGPQPVGRVIHLLLQACSSLAEAHDAGLVHRDVKPANIFVCRAADEVDVVKVLDFGLVQAVKGSIPPPPADRTPSDLPELRITRDGEPLGTPAFMAPEQALGHDIDGRADIYALACVGLWLLTGRIPFEGHGAMAIMIAHIHSPVPDLTPLVRGYYPPELDRLLRQCLAKSRDDRPEDVRTLAAGLRAVTLPPEEQWTPERARAWWLERGEHANRANAEKRNSQLGR
jgi:serine/threonine protein kinase